MLALLTVLALGQPPHASAHNMSPERLARIDGAVKAAIERKLTPGAVVVIGRRGRVVYRKAFGNRALVPNAEPMTVDTVFDLASLTKVTATAMSVMTLVEAGKIRLADPVVKHLPEFGAGGGERERVTIEQLLLHRGGLPPDDPMSLYVGTREEIFARKHRQPLAYAPGSKFVYSDAGFEVLGELVARVSGEPLDVYAKKRVFEPLGMRETGFRPKIPAARIAPTESRDGHPMRGEVHDPRAFALGGVAGHAGVFSTADDLLKFGFALLRGGAGVLSPAGVAAMTKPRSYGDGDLRALGWDVHTSYSSSRGDLLAVGSYGHTGWTGTSIWIDPATELVVIILANRVHPDGSGNVIPLRGQVATLAAAAILDLAPELLTPEPATLTAAAPRAAKPRPTADVKPGVDVLESDGFKAIAGKRVALLTNHTGVTRDGRSTIDVLASEKAKAAGVTLVRLFSPEHGIRGILDEKVSDGLDEKTGLPVRSLYGETRRPKPEDLDGLDAVVVDLQDAGTRFYTYLTSVGYLLEEAAKAKVAVVVLDRPNPIGAAKVEGPLADPEKLSFVAYHPIPIRTGMTIGELARLFNGERKLGAELAVVSLAGYRRDLWYDETGIPWTNPSPNLRSVTQAALYPGVALVEMTNLSVGRGTDAPFEWIGAPWLDAATLAATLNGRAIPGVRFVAASFTPQSSTYKGERCAALRVTVVDRDRLDPVRLGFELATAVRDRHPKEWDRTKLGTLIVNGAALARLERGDGAGEIASGWAAEQMEFERKRAGYLLY